MILLKAFAVPVLVVLYVVQAIPLLIRDGAHLCLIGLDKAFDRVANSVGWETGCWPLPAARDNPLPYERE